MLEKRRKRKRGKKDLAQAAKLASRNAKKPAAATPPEKGVA
jgi:hypothetical protein